VNLSAFGKQYDEVPISDSVMIDILKHGSSGVPLKECVDYGEHEFLLKSQEWAMERIYHNPVLLVKAIESNGTLPKDTKRSLVDEIDNIWTSNETLENKKKKLKAWATAGENSELFFGTLNAASYHEGTPIDDITIYPEHRDTVNGLVMFQQIQGKSYNFVALPPIDGKRTNTANIVGSTAYDEYKKKLSGDDLKKVLNQENHFLKKAAKIGHPQVRVYCLNDRDCLIFDACQYLHTTIVPKQTEGRPRILLIYHEMKKR